MSLPGQIPGRIFGVDVAQFQGRLDVPALQHCGAEFVIARATIGLHDVDKLWAANALACSDAGIAWSAYGVLMPYGPAQVKAQAQRFIDTVKGSGITFAPSLDFELAHGQSGRDALVSAALWLDTVEAALGCQCIVYTGSSFIDTLAKFAGAKVEEAGTPRGDAADEAFAALGRRPLWVAAYTQDHHKLPRIPEPWTEATFWQASGDRVKPGKPFGSRNFSTLPGTNAGVDLDWFFGTVGQLPQGPCPQTGLRY